MIRDTFRDVIIITADRGKFLKLLGNDESEKIIGRPERIIFSNTAEVPEMEEADIIKE